ncbi:hypothetical protein PN462_08690 [Spirulina sp. CS-785/01]|uniref:hypothetical protein n=1 Tax=Spirulina sp. CS-785/01 TaxID=3021716 RepID=UPI00232E0C03|nr:hypothetical protein [Spirulina sp. CS-785/01]MDB9313175.1 hypothetical protein [Spirulina sp. CS-785/01]
MAQFITIFCQMTLNSQFFFKKTGVEVLSQILSPQSVQQVTQGAIRCFACLEESIGQYGAAQVADHFPDFYKINNRSTSVHLRALDDFQLLVAPLEQVVELADKCDQVN